MVCKESHIFTEKADHMPRYQHIARQLKRPWRQELAPRNVAAFSRTWAQGHGRFSRHGGNAYGELVARGWLERRGRGEAFVSNALRFERRRYPRRFA